RQSDPGEFDRLTRHALGLIERARAVEHGRASIPDLFRHELERRRPMDMTRRTAAEFFGTLWLVLGGCGAAVLAAGFPSLGIGFLGVAFAVGYISGGHFNPAVTIGLWSAGRFKAADVLPYIIAQVIGAIVAAAILYLIASGKAGWVPA